MHMDAQVVLTLRLGLLSRDLPMSAQMDCRRFGLGIVAFTRLAVGRTYGMPRQAADQS